MDVEGAHAEFSEATLRKCLAGFGPDREHEVADLIRDLIPNQSDPRAFTLDSFLSVIPWIREADVALDAAIQADLAGRCHDGAVDAVETLVSQHPELKRQIQRAAILGALLETSGVLSGPARIAPADLPSDFGPPDYNGRPRYELRSLLGAGCQGTVYTAVDRLFSQPEQPCLVAIKLGHRPLTEDGERRADGEALKARRIAHPGVVRVTDHGRDAEGRPYSAFELIDGVPLDTWRQARPDRIAPRSAARIVSELCEAIQSAHSTGVVHRDIKPSNILIDRRDAARITDFGVAHDMKTPLDPSRRYSSRGSLAFMAPEQYREEPGADAPYADVYGLGGILYWLLTDTFPNGGSAEEAINRLEQTAAPVPDVLERRPDVPKALAQIIERALNPIVSQRYGSAESLGHDLRAWLDLRPIEWQRPTLLVRVSSLARRHPIKSVVALVGAVLIVGFAIGMMESRADARLHASRTVAAEREGELTAQLTRLEERRAAQEQRVIDARDRIKTWMGVLGASGYVEPGEYLAVLGSLSRLELFQEASVADMLNENRIGVAKNVLDSLAAEGHADSLESALWNGLLGTWLLQDESPDEALQRLVLAEQRMSELLDPDDPWLETIRATMALARESQAGL